MKHPDEMPEFRAQLPRTSHVLSHEFDFTCTTAHLNPIFHTIMNPGEKITLGFDYNLRTMPLEAAAFADLECHTEYFFVPMQLLYQPFDAVYYGVRDNFSSNFDESSACVLPCVDLDSVVAKLYSYRAVGVGARPNSDSPIETIGQSSIRLFDMLGFNPVGIACKDKNDGHFYNPVVFPYSFLAYHCIYQYNYRLDNRERFQQKNFNLDKFYNVYNNLDIDQDLGGNIQPWLMRYRPLDNDYFTDVKVSPIVDVLNLNVKQSFALAQSWLSRSIVNNNQVLSSGGVGSSSEISGSPLASPINDPSQSIQSNFGFQQISVHPQSQQFQANGLDINTANIRAMFANEKLWSITGRARKTYDDQTLAHFGFKVPHDVKHQISKFGHDYTKIHIGEVISTASTDNAPLGEIAGKGYGSQSDLRHSFIAPCHGVVMAIFSVVMKRNYEAGILKSNVVTGRNDFYMPEYDHLGMQPLFGYETKLIGNVSSIISAVMGWQYRYEQWKRRYNRTSGAFRQAGTLKSWVPSFIPYGEPKEDATDMYSLPKSGNVAQLDSAVNFFNFPSDVNQIFLGQYQTSWSTVYESPSNWAKIYDFDPFVVNGFISAVLVSTMSDYSLPRLDA